jgi:Amt family ammonium transporter
MSHFIPQKLEPLKSPCKGKFSLARVAKHTVLSGTALGLFALSMGVVGAEEAAATELPEVQYAIDNLFLFGCAVLVLFMQAGFAMVESGFNSSKNTVNILMKNLLDLSIGALLFWAVGFSLMYPGDDYAGKFFGFAGFGVSEAAPTPGAGTLHPQVDFFFQVVFAATAATIVSGAVAGRMKFSAYLVYSVVLTAFVYPISGMWKWGGGWLNEKGFYDFAGSLVVHAVGGFAGLAGAIVLGARKGKFVDGKPRPMPGHNLPLAALGVFILWVGWYGFNPGSQLAFSDGANTNATMLIAVNTTLAAAAGVVLAMLVGWVRFGKPDLSMSLNGALAGLVGITANCDSVTNVEAIIIGAVAGVLVVVGILMLEALKIDDPVGAWPVHGLCGVWGGLATGIFGGHPMGAQILGSVVIPIWAFVTMFVLFFILKSIGMLRVSPEEEEGGLDLSEHGMHAYEGIK